MRFIQQSITWSTLQHYLTSPNNCFFFSLFLKYPKLFLKCLNCVTSPACWTFVLGIGQYVPMQAIITEYMTTAHVMGQTGTLAAVDAFRIHINFWFLTYLFV